MCVSAPTSERRTTPRTSYFANAFHSSSIDKPRAGVGAAEAVGDGLRDVDRRCSRKCRVGVEMFALQVGALETIAAAAECARAAGSTAAAEKAAVRSRTAVEKVAATAGAMFKGGPGAASTAAISGPA